MTCLGSVLAYFRHRQSWCSIPEFCLRATTTPAIKGLQTRCSHGSRNANIIARNDVLRISFDFPLISILSILYAISILYFYTLYSYIGVFRILLEGLWFHGEGSSGWGSAGEMLVIKTTLYVVYWEFNFWDFPFEQVDEDINSRN